MIGNKAEMLLHYIDVSGWKILEIGPYNGRNTLPLARACRDVLAVEPRPENVLATQQALSGAGVRNARVIAGDARAIDEAEWGRHDLVFHAGVLYHLTDPVTHLLHVPKLAPRLWLDTHVGPRGKPERIKWACSRLPLTGYRRPERHQERLAGLEPWSMWLDLQSLVMVLKAAGYLQIYTVRNERERNGRRVSLYATQTPTDDQPRYR